MSTRVWLIPLVAVNFCFAGHQHSIPKELPPIEKSEPVEKYCTQCDRKTTEFIFFCQARCPAVMCRACEESECSNKQLIARDQTQPRKLRRSATTKLFFVCVACKLCGERIRLYENEGTPAIRRKISDRAKEEEAAFVYQ